MKKFFQIALIVTATLAVAGCFNEAVQLDATLSQTVASLSEDETVELTQITGGKIVGPAPDCPTCKHLHAASPEGIMIGPLGPFPDPNPDTCGYGCIIQLGGLAGILGPTQLP